MLHIGLNAFFNRLLREKWHVLPLVLVAVGFFQEIRTQDQSMSPITSIRELKNGLLVVRFPSYRSKTDTLTNMIKRSKDPVATRHLQKELRETEAERDSMLTQYKKAFIDAYDFSKVAYFFDYGARDLSQAQFFTLDEKPVNWQEIKSQPFYLLHFERSSESKIESLVMYDSSGEKLKKPFPNNFTRGGFSFLFASLSEKSFPYWRVSRMNKKLHKFWDEVN
jgi:hypothetical protein